MRRLCKSDFVPIRIVGVSSGQYLLTSSSQLLTLRKLSISVISKHIITPFKLQIWDTAGQDRFKCVVSSFYRNANGVIICFDITDIESFRNVNNWLEEVKRYCPDETPTILIGTKSDLKERRMVSYNMIRDYVEKKNLSYIETSSKTKENVEKCFFEFTRTLIIHTNHIEVINKITDPTIDLHNDKEPVRKKVTTRWNFNKCIII